MLSTTLPPNAPGNILKINTLHITTVIYPELGML